MGFGVRVVSVDSEPIPGPGLMGITPGRYRVIASFGKQEAAPLDLRVLP